MKFAKVEKTIHSFCDVMDPHKGNFIFFGRSEIKTVQICKMTKTPLSLNIIVYWHGSVLCRVR